MALRADTLSDVASADSAVWTIRPWRRVKPRGTFIQALAVTMKNAEPIPASAIGKPLSQCARGERRSQPYR